MALNDFYNAETLAGTALALVGPDLNVARTVSRSYEALFVGGVGYSVNVRKPATLKARSRSIGVQTAITVDTVTEAVVPVTLTDEVYSAVDVTDADLSLNLEDFGRQILKPQTDAIVYDVEALVLAEMAGVTPTIDLSASPTFAELKAAAITARKTFRNAGLPASDLYAVMGTTAYAGWIDGLTYASVGSNDALQTGNGLPSLMGFQVIENNAIDADRVIFYHRDAFHLALRAPVVPQGVSFGASVSGNGFAIRAIRDYDASTLQDRSVLSVFAGVQSLGIMTRDKTTGAASLFAPVLAADPSVV